jgi:hypothetical protein
MLDRIFNLLSSPPTPSDQTYSQNFDSMHSAAPRGADGRIHFDHCHPRRSCRPPPSCNGVLPQPAKKGGFLSKLFGGIGNALSNIFKPITSAISGIASFFSNLNPFKGLF